MSQRGRGGHATILAIGPGRPLPAATRLQTVRCRLLATSSRASPLGHEEPDLPEWVVQIIGDPRKKMRLQNYITRLVPYDDKKWFEHTAPDRYQRHMLGLLTSTMLLRLGSMLVFLGAVSCAVVLWTTMGDVRLPKFEVDPWNLSATALGLLLTVRVSESYNRFRLAHQHLATISGRLRDAARCLSIGLKDCPSRAATLDDLCCKLLSVGEVVKCTLRPNQMEDLRACLRSVGLPEEAIERVALTDHPSSTLMAELSAACVALEGRGLIHRGLSSQVQQNLSDVVLHVALCERIRRHPVPIKYTRHTSRVLLSWLAFLPLGLVPVLGVYTIPVVVFMGFGMLGIEDIAVQIEEPFTIIDIEDINRDMRRAVQEMRSTADTMLHYPVAPHPLSSRLLNLCRGLLRLPGRRSSRQRVKFPSQEPWRTEDLDPLWKEDDEVS